MFIAVYFKSMCIVFLCNDNNLPGVFLRASIILCRRYVVFTLVSAFPLRSLWVHFY